MEPVQNIRFPTKKPTIPPTNKEYIPSGDDDRDDSVTPEQPMQETHQQSLCLLSPHGPASIAIHALFHVINLSFNNTPGCTIT
jgi:hypothetical protein